MPDSHAQPIEEPSSTPGDPRGVLYAAPGSVMYESAFAEDGTITIDVYCLVCGYNLHGLRGDPVRCPECGGDNVMGALLMPARYIRTALRQMESGPTGCVAIAVFGIATVIFLLNIPWPYFYESLVSIPVVATAWVACCLYVRRVFRKRKGWGRVLFDFHAVTILAGAFLWLLGLAYWLELDVHLELSWKAVVWGCLVAGGAMLITGLRLYRSARERIATLQREAAVHIAREMVRRRAPLSAHWQ